MSESTPTKPRKFKLGDRVKCVEPEDTNFRLKRTEYDVIEVNEVGMHNETPYIRIKLEDDYLSNMWWFSRRFELVVPEHDPLVGEE